MISLTRRIIPFVLIIAATGIILSGRGTDRRTESLQKLHGMVARAQRQASRTVVQTPTQLRQIRLASAEVQSGIPLVPVDLARMIAKSDARIASLQASGQLDAMLAKESILAAQTGATGTISGTFFLPDSTPAASSRVNIYNEYGVFRDALTTSDTGTYKSRDLPVGNYYVRSRNFAYLLDYYPGVLNVLDATLVPVTDGVDVTGIDMVLRDAVTISGQVFMTDGVTPVANTFATIFSITKAYYYGVMDNMERLHFAVTDDTGHYEIGVNPGEDAYFEIIVEGYNPSLYGETDVTDGILVVIPDTATAIDSIDFVLSPVVAEDDGHEQNNTPATATTIAFGDTAHARIDPPGDVDYYTFTGTVDDTITVFVDGYVIGSSIDSYLFLIDSSGTVTLEEDDNDLFSLFGLDSHIEAFVLPYTGIYFVKVRDYFNDGGADFFYDLVLLAGPLKPRTVGDDPDVNEPNDDIATATPISFPDTVDAFGFVNGDLDFYSFVGTQGDTVSIDLLAFRLGNPLAVSVFVLDSVGSFVAFSEAVAGNDARIYSYVLPYTGKYNIRVRFFHLESDLLPEKTTYTLRIFKGSFTDAGYISGLITDASGAALSIFVFARFYEDPLGENLISSGFLVDTTLYVSNRLLEGTYYVRGRFSNSQEDTYLPSVWYADAAGDPLPVTVVAGDTTKGIDIVGILGGRINGVLSFPDSYLTDATGETEIITYGPEKFIEQNNLSFTRGYTMGPFAVGDYKVAAIHLLTDLPATYFGGGGAFGDASSTTITLAAGDITTASIATAAVGVGTITGTIYQELDSLLSTDAWEAYILAYDEGGYIVQAAQVGYDFVTGDMLGAAEYLIKGLNAGSYNLLLLAAYLQDETSEDFDSLFVKWYQDTTQVDSPFEDDEGEIYHLTVPAGVPLVTITAAAPTVTAADFFITPPPPPPVVGTDDNAAIPREFALHENYPNPFNPSTTLGFDLPAQSLVSIVVYDLLGRELVRLADETVAAGRYQRVWNGLDQGGASVPSGVYFARMVATQTAAAAPGYTRTIKMVLLK